MEALLRLQIVPTRKLIPGDEWVRSITAFMQTSVQLRPLKSLNLTRRGMLHIPTENKCEPAC